MITHIFDSLLEPVFIIDQTSKVIYCNEAASLLTDKNQRQLMRSKPTLSSLFRFNKPISYLEQLSTIKDPTPYKEFLFSSASINDGKAQMTIQPYSESAWLIYFRDVTLEERLQRKYRAELGQKESVIEDLKIARLELEKYSKNLERLVDERTNELKSLNTTMKALLDSLNQAFFVFNSQGDCLPIFSNACLDIIESSPVGKKIWEVLNIEPAQISGFKNWMHTVFMEMLPFEDLAVLGPNKRKHSQGKTIAVEYFPIRNAENTIQNIVCMASDITALVEAKKNFEYEKSKVESILKMVANRDQLKMFFSESTLSLSKLESYLSLENFFPNFEDIYRVIHTLKGGASTFSYIDLKNQCHQFESLLNLITNDFKQNIAENISQNEKKNIEASDLSILKELNKKLKKSLQKEIYDFEKMFRTKVDLQGNKIIEVGSTDFHILLNSLKNEKIKNWAIDKYLFYPISAYVGHFENLLLHTSTFLQKPMPNLKVIGDHLKIPSNKFNSLFQNLNHLLRNSLDHGIELPHIREKNKKPIKGNLTITFSITEAFSSNNLIIVFEDDGQGIDLDTLKAKLIEKKVNIENLTDSEVMLKIFDPQVSTKNEVTEISGQGVGLNAVHEEVKKLGGKLKVESSRNCFTRFTMELPFDRLEALKNAS
ncbi:MAG: ATP-binding protein [Bdellovibrionaceae bacterium]|nr:ATP-binding protein [Pseudobdellovibrionaceae bacterium]NUM58293.1 Hpt domain-containing protein [Pseudobdellovibrionaceae bacterium]